MSGLYLMFEHAGAWHRRREPLRFFFDHRREIMNTSYFYLTHDPVNEYWTRRWVEERGGTFFPLSLRDSVPDGEQALLIDWDSLDQDGREDYLADLMARLGDLRIGLHSYHHPDAETLGRKGVAVFERLEPDATTWLTDNDE
jgi:hypothetical protein